MRTLGVIGIILLLSVSLFGVSKFFFIRTDGAPDAAQYDPKRNVIYVTSPQTSRVLAVDADSGQVQRCVYVPNAAGLDIMDGGKRLVVGTGSTGGWYGTSFLTFIDIETFTVTERVAIANPIHDVIGRQSLSSPFIRRVVALANGNVLFEAAHNGQTGDWIGEYDQAKRTFTLLAYGSYLIPSDDRTVVLVPGIGFYGGLDLFSSAADSVVRSNPYVDGTACAFSHDNRLIACHYDQGSTQIFDAATLQMVRTIVTPVAGGTVAFSPDNTKLYIGVFSRSDFYVFDVNTGLLQGNLSMPGDDYGDCRLLGMDSRGFLYCSLNRGLTVSDSSSIGFPTPQSQYFGLIFPYVATPSGGPISGGTAVTVKKSNTAHPTVFFADKMATITGSDSSGIHVVSPPGNRSGPVDITVMYSDGSTLYVPEGFSYGPSIEYLNYNAGSTSGGDTLTLYALGLPSATASGVQVFIGGASATIQSVDVLRISPTTSPTYQIKLTTPRGTAGAADVVLTTPDGTDTLRRGFNYVTIQALGGATGVTQTVYDNTRGYLFRSDLDNNRVEVVDTATGHVINQFATHPGPVGLGLSLDHSTLYVTASGGVIDVIDVDNGTQRTIQVAIPSGTEMYRIGVTAKGTLFVGTNNSKESLYDPRLIEVDPNTGSYTTRLTGFNGPYVELGIARDGTHAVISSDLAAGASGNSVYFWDSFTDTFRELSVEGWSDYGVNDDASLFMGGALTFDSVFNIHNIFEAFDFVDNDGLVYGEKLDDSGALAIRPSLNSISVFDVHQGNRLVRISLPSKSMIALDAMALDSVHGVAYVNSVNGLIRVSLPNILSIGRLQPSQGLTAGGQTIVVRGFGFQPHATVVIGGKASTADFVDSTTLRVITPALPVGSTYVQVTNDDGSTYKLADTYTAVDTQPIIAATSPAIMPIGDRFSHPDVTVIGMNFSSGSVVLWNGSARPTYFVDESELLVALNPTDTMTPGAATLSVQNPGGGISNTFTIPIKAFPNITLPTSFVFPNQIVNTSSAIQTGTVTNSGTDPATLSFAVGSPFTLATDCPSTIPAAASCTLSVGFNPVAAGGYSSGILVSGDFAASIPANGYAGLAVPELVASPSQVLLPTTFNNGHSEAILTIRNLGVQKVTINNVSSDSPLFSVSIYDSNPIGAGQSRTLSVKFLPTAVGTFSGHLIVDSTAGTLVVPLTGSAIQPIGFDTNTLTIAGIRGQTTPSHAVAIFTNSSGSGITISSVSLSNDGASQTFSQTNTCGTVLDAGASCQFNVSYVPSGAAHDTGVLMVSVNTLNYILSLNGAVTDFTLGSGTTPTATVSAGQTATYSIPIDASNGYRGDLTFSCSGVPANSTCSVSPQTLTVGTGSSTLTVSVTTTPRSSAALHSPPTGFLAFAFVPIGCLIFLKPCRRSSIVMLFLVCVLALTSCGGGGSVGGPSLPAVNGTPAGSYTIIVTASTPGGATRQLRLVLNVS